ncbi:MAG: hypothetical protein HYX37_05150 [Rhizobiales bacterium]|nr:hypothetical protein [Hyphomicrobiales bacterium]
MTTVSEFDPIFVHASARSGSTYFFNVLRRNKSLLCFNEAIIDGKRDYARFRGTLNGNSAPATGAQNWNVNHHFLDRPDYAEFIDAWDAVMHLCPEFPTFPDYLPPKGVLPADLTTYLAALMAYARSQGKRPVLCEINSRGRAGALRGAFGGFHVTQYRDPLSQFGSYIRPLIEAGTWGFLAHPVTELGTCRAHPLYRLVPEAWRAPDLPWQAETRALRWASDARYTATVASPRPENMEKVFGWHIFSWALSNLAAISYSDLALDIDKAYADAEYRASVTDSLAQRIGAAPDFSDLSKFDRYCEFESFDMAAVCGEVVSTIRDSLDDGRLDEALRTLGTQPPTTPTATAVELLLAKIADSLASMASSADRRIISDEDWAAIAEKNQKLWFNPNVRWFAQHFYPVVAPLVRTARRVGMNL